MPSGRETFDGGDGAAEGFVDAHLAGLSRLTVDEDGAGAANFNTAAVFGSGETDDVPENPEHRDVV